MKFNVDDLVEKGLVTKKTYTDGPYAGLSVLKYKNNVFWDNLWHTDERLLQCRGLVVDSEDNVVVWPFTKIFNHHENNTDLPSRTVVDAVRKVNGFMAAAAVYKGEVLISTTGTLDSEFSKIAKQHILDAVSKSGHRSFWTAIHYSGLALIFEICDSSDPHIVPEEEGAYLIGARDMTTGEMISESQLDTLAISSGFKRPVWFTVKFGDVVTQAKVAHHEGYVVRDADSGELLLKIKTPHYLATKFLMRGKEKKWDLVWDNPETAKQRVDEEFYPLVDHLRWAFEKSEWAEMTSATRRQVIEDYFGGTWVDVH